MSTVALTLNKNEVNAIERGVSKITVGVGELVVVPLDGKPTVVSEGDSLDVKDLPVTVLALEGSNYAAVYTEPTGTEAPVLPREVPATLAPEASIQTEAPKKQADKKTETKKAAKK